MKKTIHGVGYELRPIPPSLAPYSARIIALLQRTPANVDETREASKELGTLIKELLAETVKPAPPPEDELEVYNVLVQVTNQTLEKAKFFQGNRRPETEAGKSAGSVAPQAP